jgi:hypothetical protein
VLSQTLLVMRSSKLCKMSLDPMENLDYRVKLPDVHPACCSPVAAPTGVGAPRGVKPRGAPPHSMSCCCKPIAVLADGSENELIILEAAHPPAPADHPPAPADHPPAPAPAQSQQSGSSESHPGVEPLLLGDRIRARAAKQRLLKKMTFSHRFPPLN